MAVAIATLLVRPARAQDNYEVQVYGASTVPKGRTMVELHSNFTVDGRSAVENGVLPTRHSLHETIEITHGFTPWLEVGFYIFTSARGGDGLSWVGDHIRPRFAAPESWHLPVGLSLSQEFGYQRRLFAQDTWTWEIRPIVDQKVGRFYWSFNPTLERAIEGENTGRGFEFSPNFAASFDVTEKISAGIEYYGALGPLSGFDPRAEQEHQLFAALNLDFGPKWEFNFAVGRGLTAATDPLLVKTILGYRFDF